jgi:hypothetical protein
MAKKAAHKATKKKLAKKPVKRAKKPPIKADVVIKVACDGINCVSDFDGKHTGGAGKVILFCAPTSAVTLLFRKNGTPAWPFTSGSNPLQIAKGTCVPETISSTASGTYTYHPTCSGCGSLAADPTMIVP